MLASDWIETPCTILTSEVEDHSDSDSQTYQVALLLLPATYRPECDEQFGRNVDAFFDGLPAEPAVAVNQTYAFLDEPLGAEDEVAFIPPVAGG